VILKLYCFLEVIVFDDDFNDDDLLKTMNSYMQNDDDINEDRMYEKW